MWDNQYFKLSLWSEWLILVFAVSPGVFCLLADVLEHPVGSTFWVDENTGVVFSMTQKVEPTRSSEMSANKQNTPGKDPKTRINNSWDNVILLMVIIAINQSFMANNERDH